MAARQAVDDSDVQPVIVTRKPVEDRLGGCDTWVVPGRDLQLDEGCQAPERTRPLAIGVDAETAVRLLPGEESAYFVALNDLILLVLGFFIEQLALRDEANGRLVRREEPLD
jgi:hypothetical protein